MDDGEVEQFFERVKVAIAMQQSVLFADAERRDQAIDRLSHRVSAAAQDAIVPGRVSSNLGAARAEHFQGEQLSLDILRDSLVAYALQDLTQNQIREGETFAVERCMEPVGFRIRHAPEVVDPDGGIDDDHRVSPRDAALA